jgi:hypothetical protein
MHVGSYGGQKKLKWICPCLVAGVVFLGAVGPVEVYPVVVTR